MKNCKLRLLSLMLCACQGAGGGGASTTSSSGTTTTSTTTAPSKPVDIKVWTAPYGSMGGTDEPQGQFVADVVFAKYKEAYPDANVNLSLEIIPWDGINETMTAAIASKTLPDVYMDGALRVLSYANMNAVLPLNDLFTAEELAEVQGNPALMKLVGLGDQIYSYPFAQTVILLMMNKTIWENAGALDLLPQDEWRTWTMEEFEAAMAAVADPETGTFGITMHALNEQGDQLYTNTMGNMTGNASLFTYDNNGVPTGTVVGQNQGVLDALSMFDRINDLGYCHANPESLASSTVGEYYYQGKSGTMTATAIHSKLINDGKKNGTVVDSVEYYYVNYPSLKKGEGVLRFDAGQGCAFKTGDPEREAAAKKFFWFLYHEDTTFYEATGIFSKYAVPDFVKNDPELQWVLSLLDAKSGEWPYLDTGTGIKGYSELRAALYPQLQAMFAGDITPEQAATKIGDEWNTIIQKNN